jgi:hypothetical protein
MVFGEGVPIAAPTEEQYRRRAGLECGDDRDRLIRLCSAFNCGVNEETGRAKLTAQAQWIMCVVASVSSASMEDDIAKPAMDMSLERAVTFSSGIESERDFRELVRRSVADSVGLVRKRT